MKKNNTLTEKDVMHIASLAGLELTNEELSIFTPQLAEILSYFKDLQRVDTEGVEPTFHASGSASNRFQENKPKSDTLSQEDVLKNAKEKKNGFILTKQVIGLS